MLKDMITGEVHLVALACNLTEFKEDIMKKVLILALFGLLIFANGAYCADGDELTTNNFRIDSNGEMWFKNLTEVVSTNDTVTAAESGKVFLVSSGGGYAHVKIALPAVAAGLTYTFVQQGTGTLVEIEPQSDDAFAYSTASTGDRIIGPATAGASATVYASDDTTWFVSTNGTFTVQVDN